MTTAPIAPYLFGAIAVTIAVHAYLWRRLVDRLALPRPWRRVAAAGLALAATSLPAGMLGLLYMRVLTRAVAAPLMTGVFTYAGVLFFATLITLTLDAFRAARALGHRQKIGHHALHPRTAARATIIITALLAIVAVAQAFRPPRVRARRVTVPGLAPALSGYRVVHLSDLHVGPTLGGEFVAALVAAVNAEAPDLVVITGDLVDGAPNALGPLLMPLKALRATDGVYMALGNHEYLSGVEEWKAFLPTLDVRVLHNARVRVRDGFDLVGFDDLASPDPPPLAAWPGDKPVIVLAHEPLAVRTAARLGAALQLSGHTHGGQIFPLHFLEWLDQKYVSGLYQVGPTTLHVSPGAGFWGPPMRLGSRAEISVITLVSPDDTP